MSRSLASIYLTGFSGTGKSTVGKALAFKMNRPFFDLDDEVEILSGHKIDTLIETKGLEYFRSLETQILNSLTLTQSSVIALGGGTLIDLSNRSRVQQSGFLAYLCSSIDRIQSNLTTLKGRPLIKSVSSHELELLYEQRKSGYKTAQAIVMMDGLTIGESCERVYEEYRKWQNFPV